MPIKSMAFLTASSVSKNAVSTSDGFRVPFTWFTITCFVLTNIEKIRNSDLSAYTYIFRAVCSAAEESRQTLGTSTVR